MWRWTYGGDIVGKGGYTFDEVYRRGAVDYGAGLVGVEWLRYPAARRAEEEGEERGVELVFGGFVV